jgi:hypothetical protein
MDGVGQPKDPPAAADASLSMLHDTLWLPDIAAAAAAAAAWANRAAAAAAACPDSWGRP